MKITSIRRGAHRKEDCTFIGVWIPKEWVDALDILVRREDSDRSKLVRRAVQERLEKQAA